MASMISSSLSLSSSVSNSPAKEAVDESSLGAEERTANRASRVSRRISAKACLISLTLACRRASASKAEGRTTKPSGTGYFF
jgi:hypothetical protein